MHLIKVASDYVALVGLSFYPKSALKWLHHNTISFPLLAVFLLNKHYGLAV